MGSLVPRPSLGLNKMVASGRVWVSVGGGGGGGGSIVLLARPYQVSSYSPWNHYVLCMARETTLEWHSPVGYYITIDIQNEGENEKDHLTILFETYCGGLNYCINDDDERHDQ